LPKPPKRAVVATYFVCNPERNAYTRMLAGVVKLAAIDRAKGYTPRVSV
jgi:hypothetical protein